MNRQKLVKRVIFTIIIPMVVSLIAGFQLTYHGGSNIGLTIWFLIMGVCVVIANLEEGGNGILVALWTADLITGFLYCKVLEGILSEMNSFLFAFYILLFAFAVYVNVEYFKFMLSEVSKGLETEEQETDDTQQAQTSQENAGNNSSSHSNGNNSNP